MIAYEILRVLNTFFQPGDQLLTAAIIIEIFYAIDKVSMLSKMQVFLRLALLTHPPALAVLDGADKRRGLLMF